MKGFRADECDSMAFSICYSDGNLVLDDLNETGEWSVSTDNGGSFVDIYGKATIPFACLIRYVNKVTRETVTIEVSSV